MKSFITILLSISFLVSCKQVSKVQTAEIKFETMGTFGLVKIVSDSLALDDALILQKIDSLLIDVNMGVSTYIDSSIISKANQSGYYVTEGNESYREHFELNLFRSYEIADATNGNFNMFIKPLVDFWGFGDYDQRSLAVKDSMSIDSILQCMSIQDILKKDISRCLKLDFSAIAKGYGVDQVAELLNSEGYDRYMVEIGGEVYCKGKNAEDVLWRLGIEEPNEETRSIFEIVELNSQAMATSGNYRNYKVLENGQKVVHIINPKTGYPEISNLLSASIVADDCMSADAYATACMVMGVDTCYQFLLDQPGLEGYLIYSDDNGELQVKLTEGFEAMIVE